MCLEHAPHLIVPFFSRARIQGHDAVHGRGEPVNF
jgi:hypothetical protein